MPNPSSTADKPVAAKDPNRHQFELEALYTISRLLGSGQRQRQVLAEVLDVLHDRLGMERGTIMLLSPDSNELTMEAAHGLPEGGRATSYKPGEGIAGRVLASGKPAIVPKVSEEPLFLDRLHKRRRPHRRGAQLHLRAHRHRRGGGGHAGRGSKISTRQPCWTMMSAC